MIQISVLSATASNNRSWAQMLYKINRTTCEKVRSQMKKAQKINRRATLICLLLSTRTSSRAIRTFFIRAVIV